MDPIRSIQSSSALTSSALLEVRRVKARSQTATQGRLQRPNPDSISESARREQFNFLVSVPRQQCDDDHVATAIASCYFRLIDSTLTEITI
jgi:hypothetical protein